MSRRPLKLIENDATAEALAPIPHVSGSPYPQLQNSTIQTCFLGQYIQDYIDDCRYRALQTRATVEAKSNILDQLSWFLADRGYEQCGVLEIRRFQEHVASGHREPGGRFGNPRLNKPASARTIQAYWVGTKVFFDWLVGERVLEVSPFERQKMPKAKSMQPEPFADAEMEAILYHARRSEHGKLYEAMIRLMEDGGVRVSELINIHWRDVSLAGLCCQVMGKGGKPRTVYFGRKTRSAIRSYIAGKDKHEDDLLFLSESGNTPGEGFTRSGVQQFVEKICKRAGIKGKRCSPHTFRHTFATNFLRNGGNVFALQALLGHESLAMSQRYTKFAQTDLARQHAEFSPGDRRRA